MEQQMDVYAEIHALKDHVIKLQTRVGSLLIKDQLNTHQIRLTRNTLSEVLDKPHKLNVAMTPIGDWAIRSGQRGSLKDLALQIADELSTSEEGMERFQEELKKDHLISTLKTFFENLDAAKLAKTNIPEQYKHYTTEDWTRVVDACGPMHPTFLEFNCLMSNPLPDCDLDLTI